MTHQFESYDNGAFVVFTTRWGTYSSRDKDGNGLCCGMNKEDVIFWSREHLNGFQLSTVHVTDIRVDKGYKL